MMDVFHLGVPGPSGHENDTYVAEQGVYKVNNLLNNNGSIVALLHKILLHNAIFPDTAYSFRGFAGFDVVPSSQYYTNPGWPMLNLPAR